MSPEQAALIEFDSSVSDAADTDQHSLQTVLANLEQWISDTVNTNHKQINKVARRADHKLALAITSDSNDLDKAVTKLLSWVEGHINVNEWTLTGVSVKSGLIDAGDTLLDIQWDTQLSPSLGPEYGGTLVLSCRELTPLWTELIEVLREIRDRLPSVPATMPGEAKATAMADDISGELPSDEKDVDGY